MPSTINQYTCIKKLGEGATAVVKLARDDQGQLCALKIFKKDNLANTVSAMKTLSDEVTAYKGLSHKHIVALLDFREDATWTHGDGRTE